MERTHIFTLNMNEYAIQHYLAKHFHIQYRVSLYSLCVDVGVDLRLPSRVSLLTSSTSFADLKSICFKSTWIL